MSVPGYPRDHLDDMVDIRRLALAAGEIVEEDEPDTPVGNVLDEILAITDRYRDPYNQRQTLRRLTNDELMQELRRRGVVA